MIDAKAFGEELAGIVKAATAPLIDRIDELEKQLAAIPEPEKIDVDEIVKNAVEQSKVELSSEAADRETADAELLEKLDSIEIPELPDIDAIVAVEVEKAVSKAVEALPVPADGKDGEPGPQGEKGDPGRDGLDVKDLFRADGGRLVAVMSDGTTKDLGVFVGADGKDGERGQDGADGLGFEDMDFETDEHGRVTAKFQRGDIVKSVRLPGIVDRGPYRAGDEYIKGDAVSYGGSLWIAQGDTSDKPDGGKGWRLAVKRGRDGKGA